MAHAHHKLLLRRILLVIPLLLLIAAIPPQRQNWEALKRNLNRLHQEFPAEKAYLHTDRSLYQAGEHIWFKAWHTEGYTNIPSAAKVMLTLELIDPLKRIVQTHLLQARDGRACGSLLLSDTLPEGKYTLRLFSDRMLAFDPKNAYECIISVVNPLNSYHSRKGSRKLSKSSLQAGFYPEGGPLLAGTSCKVGIKITGPFGQGVAVEYRVVDDSGNIIARGSTRFSGISAFTILPENRKKYWLETGSGDVLERFRLPEAAAEGAALSLSRSQGMIKAKLHAAGLRGPYLLLLQDPSGLKNSWEIPFDSGGSVDVPLQGLAAGICILTAFDARGLPISERLFFNGLGSLRYPVPAVEISDANDSIDIRISLPEGERLGTSAVSVGITTAPKGGGPFINSPAVTMLAELMLVSSLRGQVDDPAWYFSGATEATEALDELLMTQGWSRYTWSKLAEGAFPAPLLPNSSTIGISGKVTRTYLNLPAGGMEVRMTVMDQYFDQFLDTTDAEGRFAFGGLEYEDTINLLIESRLSDGRPNLLIEVDGAMEAAAGGAPRFTGPLRYEGNEVLGLDRQLLERENPSPRRVRKSTGIHSEADHVIYFDQTAQNYRSPLEALVNVPGVDIQGTGINTRVLVRGASSMVLNNEPLYVVDGVPVDRFTANSIYSGDVDRIELLSGTRAAIYGLRGGNGVVAIFTKRGSGVKPGELGLKIRGFTACKEYFVPAAGTSVIQEIPRTLGWFPMLTPDASGNVTIRVPRPEQGSFIQYRLEALSDEGQIFSSGIRTLE